MLQLSGLDASFMYFETPTTPMHVGSFSIYDPSTVPDGGKIRFKQIIRHVEQRLGQSRTFRQRAVPVPFNLDHPYWIEDPDFDIEYHIRHIALPEPGDWRQLCIQIARLHSRHMDLSKPQWEMTVIEGLNNVAGLPKGSFAVLTKMHHAAVDGVSGMEIITVLHDTRPDAPPPEPKPWTPEAVPSPLDLITRAHFNNMRQPLRFAE
ncbi:MAG TPA: wax ester/triacylglycerol synthase domain-containing protein, partial [Vineibacter sp.]|nr:wax ester/triacylglycerol synthase domain-containing protein [Vineibacter sp.]